jgi:hypothetical protein
MLKKIIQYYHSFRKHNFSFLADYGDLSKYNYNQMSIILIKWNRILIEGNGYFDAEWECNSTQIRIRYNNSTSYFIQIVEK